MTGSFFFLKGRPSSLPNSLILYRTLILIDLLVEKLVRGMPILSQNPAYQDEPSNDMPTFAFFEKQQYIHSSRSIYLNR